MTLKKGYRLTPDEEALLRDAPTGKRPWTSVLPLVLALALMIGAAYLVFGFLTWQSRQKEGAAEPPQTVTNPPNSGSGAGNNPQSL
jgi:hypothetical protein